MYDLYGKVERIYVDFDEKLKDWGYIGGEIRELKFVGMEWVSYELWE